MNKLGERLKELREAAGLTQWDVASKLNYTSPQFVSNFERGGVRPPTSKIRTLARIFKADANEIFALCLEHSLYMTAEQMKKDFKRSK